MRMWKWVGLGALAGLTTGGAALVARRRHWRSCDTNQIRDILHQRLADLERVTEELPATPSS